MARVRHLWVSRRITAACKNPNATGSTTDPNQVTCRGCQRTIYMHDARIKATNPQF